MSRNGPHAQQLNEKMCQLHSRNVPYKTALAKILAKMFNPEFGQPEHKGLFRNGAKPSVVRSSADSKDLES
eukprot:2737482-Amphidinium_carterae.1